MIPRAHGLALSLLLGAASAAGAYALIGTAKLGDAQTKPEVVVEPPDRRKSEQARRVGGVAAEGARDEASCARRR